MKKTHDRNYLDIVFCHKKDLKWEVNEQGFVTLLVENKGFFNLLAQKIFGRPRISKIKLDEPGSYVWIQIDGGKNVFEIAALVRVRFGESAEPLYDRLAKFFMLLTNQGFIEEEPVRS